MKFVLWHNAEIIKKWNNAGYQVKSKKGKVKIDIQKNKIININDRTYDFSINVITFIKNFHSNVINTILVNQLIRSTTSIGANIIEAQSSISKREFIRYYSISLRSSNETRYWLNILKDTTSIDKITIERLINESKEISNILASCLIKMKAKYL
jgi:four helix bundle protein